MKIFFTITIFLSSFLLFQIQPLSSKLFLPLFGGSAYVWTSAMMVFQVLLLAGYYLAHILVKQSAKRQLMIYVSGSIIVLIYMVAQVSLWGSPLLMDFSLVDGIENVNLKIVSSFLISVGLPFLLLSMTSSIAQTWYRYHAPKESPYFLYGYSNMGSLLGLFTYPFISEYFWGLKVQALVFGVIFILFLIHMIGLAFSVLRNPLKPEILSQTFEKTKPLIVSKSQIWKWLLLSFATGSILLATTNKLTMEVGAVSILWVAPLAIYLVSYIITFKDTDIRKKRFVIVLFILLLLNIFHFAFGALGFLLPLAVLFCTTVLCHKVLYDIKPVKEKLTLFYLTISLGGALSGIFVGILCPIIFSGLLEYEFSLFLCFGLLVYFEVTRPYQEEHKKGRKLIIENLILIIIFIPIGMVAGSFNDIKEGDTTLAQTRNFYGILKVKKNPETGVIKLMHGHTMHGQYSENEPNKVISNYYVNSPLTSVFDYMKKEKPEGLNAAVLGLGAGEMAAYCDINDHITYYEIDDAVVKYSGKGGKYFHHLNNTQASIKIVKGDARISLSEELEAGSHEYDMLVIDAFSGDAIPFHLLTTEAFKLFQSHLKPDGVILVHISNRYFDLFPIIKAQEVNLDSSIKLYTPTKPDCYWVIISSNEELSSHMASSSNIKEIPPKKEGKPWSDDYSSPLSIWKQIF